MFNPSQHLILLKGKDYLPVAWRLVWFREDHPDWGIDTVMIERDEDHAVFVAKITDEGGRIVCSGHGSESKRDFADFTEKAETKAAGRALAMLGYGTQFVGDELDEGERIVDSPIERNTVCDCCGKPIKSARARGSIWQAADIIQYGMEHYGKPMCAKCLHEREAEPISA